MNFCCRFHFLLTPGSGPALRASPSTYFWKAAASAADMGFGIICIADAMSPISTCLLNASSRLGSRFQVNSPVCGSCTLTPMNVRSACPALTDGEPG